jgi:hypothetical protein
MTGTARTRAKHRWLKEPLTLWEISQLPTAEERAQALLRRVEDIEQQGRRNGLTEAVRSDLARLRRRLEAAAGLQRTDGKGA